MPNAFVLSVEYFEITLTDAGPESYTLTKGQDIDNCVPMGVTVTSTQLTLQTRRVDLYFDSGDIVAERVGTSPNTTVAGYVVEFDPAEVDVQQGTFSMGTSASANPSITDIGDQADGFVVAYWKASASYYHFNIDELSYIIDSDGAGVTLSRGSSYAGFSSISGHFFVVSTSGGHFSTQVIQDTSASTSESETVSITSVDTSETFVIASRSGNGLSEGVLEAGWIADLQDATTFRYRRAYDSFGGSPGSAGDAWNMWAQVVTVASGLASVQRAECDWADATTKAVSISTIDQDESIIVPGSTYGLMSSTETAGSEIDGNYARMEFSADDEVTGTRGDNTAPDGTTFFEVVEWALAAPPSLPDYFPPWPRVENTLLRM